MPACQHVSVEGDRRQASLPQSICRVVSRATVLSSLRINNKSCSLHARARRHHAEGLVVRVKRLELQVAGEALDDELVELVGDEGEILLSRVVLQRDERSE